VESVESDVTTTSGVEVEVVGGPGVHGHADARILKEPSFASTLGSTPREGAPADAPAISKTVQEYSWGDSEPGTPRTPVLAGTALSDPVVPVDSPSMVDLKNVMLSEKEGYGAGVDALSKLPSALILTPGEV